MERIVACDIRRPRCDEWFRDKYRNKRREGRARSSTAGGVADTAASVWHSKVVSKEIVRKNLAPISFRFSPEVGSAQAPVASGRQSF